jgi:hypothetical protein
MDLNNRKVEFDTLMESVNFKKFEKEALLKLMKKHIWLKQSVPFLNIIVWKGMNDDDESDDEKDDESDDSDNNKKKKNKIILTPTKPLQFGF